MVEKIKAMKNSFHAERKAKEAMATSPGPEMGSTIRTNAPSRVHPSMRAASSNSRGTSRMNVAISQMPIGRLSVACARMTAA